MSDDKQYLTVEDLRIDVDKWCDEWVATVNGSCVFDNLRAWRDYITHLALKRMICDVKPSLDWSKQLLRMYD